jgi:hypothetical protein
MFAVSRRRAVPPPAQSVDELARGEMRSRLNNGQLVIQVKRYRSTIPPAPVRDRYDSSNRAP